MLKSFWILTICAVLPACASAPRVAQQTEREVQQASDEFLASVQRRDTSSFVAHFTEDGTFMVPGLPDAAGHGAIRELAGKRFAGQSTEDFEVHRREIELTSDTAYELAWFSETSRQQGQAYRMQGRYFILWKLGSDERWRVHRYMYNFSDATPLP